MLLFAKKYAFLALSLTIVSSLTTPLEAGHYFDFGTKKAEEDLTANPAVPEAAVKEETADKAAPVADGITVVEIAANNQTFSTLYNALQTAGLVDALKTKGPFTIFIPNNEAFKKLSPGALASWLQPENRQKLSDLLKSHIVAGKITSKEIKSGKIKTLSGKELDVRVSGNDVTINGAKVTRFDLVGSNGVVWVIDTVITN